LAVKSEHYAAVKNNVSAIKSDLKENNAELNEKLKVAEQNVAQLKKEKDRDNMLRQERE
jgi:DNA-binding Xre family transcriptional regulator